MKISSQKIALIIFITFLAISGWLIFTPCPINTDITQNLPDYIKSPWPPPDADVYFGCYLRKNILGNILFIREDAFSIEILPIALLKRKYITLMCHLLKRGFLYF